MMSASEKSRDRRRHSYPLLATATLLVASVTPWGVAFNAGAASAMRLASANPFCQSMIGTHPAPPTNSRASAYHHFAKQYLAYYVKLQREAKDLNAKSSLRLLLPILKVEAGSTNMKSLAEYVAANELTWAREWQVFDKSVVTCARWAVALL